MKHKLYLINPNKKDYKDFLYQNGVLRIFKCSKTHDFYCYPAKDATHLNFTKVLGLTHKIGTNLGVNSNNEIALDIGILVHLDKLGKELPSNLFSANIKALEEILYWLKKNYDVGIDNANCKIKKTCKALKIK